MKRLRQVALVARELDPVVAALRQALGLGTGFRDPGVAEFGLRNTVLPVGDQFLEVVSPVAPETTAGRFLDRRGGDGGYMVLVQTDDLAGDRARLAAAGVRVVWEITLDDIAAVHLHPRDVGGAIVSLDAPVVPESWRWGGPGWQDDVRREVCTGISGVEIAAHDPARMAARWGEVVGREARHDPEGWAVALDDATLRFVAARDARGEGVDGLALRAATPSARGVHAIGGVRITIT